MSPKVFVAFTALTVLVVGSITGCAHQENGPDEFGLERIFPTEAHSGEEYSNCIFTSPKWYDTDDGPRILVFRAAGIIDAVDPDTGEVDWSVSLPEPSEGVKFLLATPALVDDKLVAAYMAIPDDYGDHRGPTDDRFAHLVAVVDLAERQVDDSFPVVELEAELDANEPDRTLSFRPGNALTRSNLAHVTPSGSELGRVYVTQGNLRDIQPWHGWAWEIDLDAWRDDGADAAINAVLNTTPEPDENCGDHGTSGSRDRECGGGLWAPTGHLVVEEDDGYHLILAPGNGQLDIHRRDYANTLMKVEPGLDFDPKCDEEACADFDSDQPSRECMESCENLFIPRLMEGQQLQRAPDGRCDDYDTLFECWGVMDYIGGSTPVHVELDDHEVLVYPTKDGHAYLVDAHHLGTMYDRHRMVEMCGHHGGDCTRIWAGMAVTKPVKTEIGGQPAVIVANFMPDDVNAGGLVAMKVVERNGEPTLERAWEYPDFNTTEATERFRNHPSAVTLGADGEHVWVVDIFSGGGILTGVRIEDGEPIYQTVLDGPGRRYVYPLVDDDRVFVPSCHRNGGPGQLEGYQIVIE